jgi:uncharacterized protein YndB with AHSA1/START domain
MEPKKLVESRGAEPQLLPGHGGESWERIDYGLGAPGFTPSSAPEGTRPGFATTRLFDADPALLLRAWTEEEHLARWWGPKGFSNAFETFEPRPGGQWRFTMHGPDGSAFPNHSVFVEVGPERIVLDHLSGPRFQIRATFPPVDNRTRLTFAMLFDTSAECEALRGFAQPAHEQMFDRLEAELARMRQP